MSPPAENATDGWTQWLLQLAAVTEIPVSEELRTLLVDAGATIPAADGLHHYLDALEPAARDVALQTQGIAIMSMMRSKGLTRTAAIIMGVEAGIVPSPRAEEEEEEEEEERRLLYVAMTRARRFLDDGEYADRHHCLCRRWFCWI